MWLSWTSPPPAFTSSRRCEVFALPLLHELIVAYVAESKRPKGEEMPREGEISR